MFKNTEQTGKTVSSTYGTHCRMLAPANANVIRNNTFKDMAYANWAEENNGNAIQGLHYLCNDHTNPIVRGWNFIANDPDQGGRAMRLNQGLQKPNLSYAPARNVFSQVMPDNSGGSDNLRDFWVTNGIGTNYTYYYWTGAPLEEPIYENINTVGFDDASGNGCPQPYKDFGVHLVGGDKDEVRNKYFEHQKDYELSKEAYKVLTESNSSTIALEDAQKVVAYHRQQMDGAAYAAYSMELSDSLVVRDSVRLWMRRFDNPTGDYMLASDYLANQEYEMSHRVLERMLHKYEFTAQELEDYDNMLFLYDVLIAGGDEDLSAVVLKKMESIAESEEGQASYMARRILSSDYGYFYLPIVSILPEQHGEKTSSDGTDYTGPKMLVLPNPTDYFVHFDWSEFATSGKEVIIEVTSQTGGLIDVLKPGANSTGMDWTTEKVTGSSCYYRLIVDGQEVYGGHIVINK